MYCLNWENVCHVQCEMQEFMPPQLEDWEYLKMTPSYVTMAYLLCAFYFLLLRAILLQFSFPCEHFFLFSFQIGCFILNFVHFLEHRCIRLPSASDAMSPYGEYSPQIIDDQIIIIQVQTHSYISNAYYSPMGIIYPTILLDFKANNWMREKFTNDYYFQQLVH